MNVHGWTFVFEVCILPSSWISLLADPCWIFSLKSGSVAEFSKNLFCILNQHLNTLWKRANCTITSYLQTGYFQTGQLQMPHFWCFELERFYEIHFPYTEALNLCIQYMSSIYQNMFRKWQTRHSFDIVLFGNTMVSNWNFECSCFSALSMIKISVTEWIEPRYFSSTKFFEKDRQKNNKQKN